MRAKRNYKKEYEKFHSDPKAIEERRKRNGRRRKAMKEGRVKKGDGMHIHHTATTETVMPASKNMGMKEKSRLKGWLKRRKKK